MTIYGQNMDSKHIKIDKNHQQIEKEISLLFVFLHASQYVTLPSFASVRHICNVALDFVLFLFLCLGFLLGVVKFIASWKLTDIYELSANKRNVMQ